MKGICGEQLNNCMLLGDCENGGDEAAAAGVEDGVAVGGGGGGGGGLAASTRRVRLRQVQSMAVPHDQRLRHPGAALPPRQGTRTLGPILIIIAYLMGIFFYSLPIFLIQAFLGQFSTSGSISAFRVAPIFKGIGYSILLINLGTLSYYSIGAVVPLIYAVNALHAVIPWTHCNNTWNSDDCSTHDNYDPDSLAVDPHSTVEFFRYLLPPFYNVQDLLGVGSRAFVMAGLALGPGCGSIINLASYNSFRSDAERMSVWVCLTHATIGLMAVLCCNVAHDHFEDHVGMLPFHVDEKHDLQYLYLSFSYLFGRFSTVPNLWAFLFFVVIFLAELSALVIQLLSVVTSLFDEFEC
ncbi:GL18855 [Drosophila persimilis]|uniref:GL18855 n=1 Tax=Drosophila persimilis TaxID=7234 RepID=B4G8D9_DROPE|nr:GL18855 [Drosophila persimilis]